MKKRTVIITLILLICLYFVPKSYSIGRPQIDTSGRFEKIYLELGTKYETFKSAKDALGNDISDRVVIEGHVNENMAGEYKVTYKVTDKDGNESLPYIETVIVLATEKRERKYYSQTSEYKYVQAKGEKFAFIGTAYNNTTLYFNDNISSSTSYNTELGVTIINSDNEFVSFKYKNNILDIVKYNNESSNSAELQKKKEVYRNDYNFQTIERVVETSKDEYLLYVNSRDYKTRLYRYKWLSNSLEQLDRIENNKAIASLEDGGVIFLNNSNGQSQLLKKKSDLTSLDIEFEHEPKINYVDMKTFNNNIYLFGELSNKTYITILNSKGKRVKHEEIKSLENIRNKKFSISNNGENIGIIYEEKTKMYYSVINSNTLKVEKTGSIDSNFQVNDIAINSNDDIMLVGKQGNIAATERITKLPNIVTGLSNFEINQGDKVELTGKFQYKDGEILKESGGEEYEKYISENVGIHEIYYTLTLSPKNKELIFYRKKITVTTHPKIKFKENSEFNGIFNEDIEGTQSILINEEEYISGSDYTMPGAAILKIKGVNGYIKEIPIKINLIIEELEKNKKYKGSVTPKISGGILKLNGNDYKSGTTIETPGNYTMKISNQRGTAEIYNFIVEPDETKIFVKSNDKFNKPTILTNLLDVTLLVDGEKYENNSYYSEIGKHVLTIIGKKNYILNISFTVEQFINVNDGDTYNDLIKLEFLGKATLNGKEISFGETIDEVGNYELIVKNKNIEETRKFTLEPLLNIEKNGIYGKEKKIKIDYASLKNPSYKFNNEVNDDLIVKKFGKQKLEISGINYNQIYYFDIIPEIIGIEKDKVYYESVTPQIEGYKLLLNNQPYISGTVIKEPNIYLLKLINNITEKIEYEISFAVSDIQWIIEDEKIYYQDELNISFNKDIFEVEVDGDIIESQQIVKTYGKHIIKLKSKLNNEKKVFHIYLLPNIDIRPNQILELKDQVKIDNKNLTKIFLNDEKYIPGSIINEVGHYTLLLIFGEDVNEYRHEIKFTVKENSDLFQSEYNKPVNLQHIPGDIYVNGKEKESNILTQFGKYEIVIRGTNDYESSYSFIVLPFGDKVSPNQVYTKKASFNFENVREIFLNDSKYKVNTIIEEVGNYRLTLKGEGDYSLSYQFSLEAEIEGFYDKQEFYEGSQVHINASNYQKMLLNNEEIENGYKTKKIGTYELIVKGINGYEKKYGFNILLRDLNLIQDGIYEEPVRIEYSNIDAYLDGAPYNSNIIITEIGNHVLKFKGVGGYEKEYNFTIKVPDSIDRKYNNKTFKSKEVMINLDAEMFLNNSLYVGAYIMEVGYHELKIKGKNHYNKTIRFTIEYETNLVNGKVYKEPIEIYSNNANITVDNNRVYNKTIINTKGEHIIKVEGVNGYKKEIIIFYSGVYERLVFYLGIPTIALTGIGIVWIALRKKKIF